MIEPGRMTLGRNSILVYFGIKLKELGEFLTNKEINEFLNK